MRVIKKKKVSKREVRKAIRKQLSYVKRNLKHVQKLCKKTPLSVLSKRQYRNLLVTSELYRQQQQMFDQKNHSVQGRIVSISQPHVRPIIRGKAASNVEFGAKLSISVVDGYVFNEKLSWEAYNEGIDLIDQVEKYKTRFGYYPESVHVDKIYRNRDNRNYCSERKIRISGPALGRPPSDEKKRRELKKQSRQDEVDRIPVEGKFGNGKRRYGLNRIREKRADTSETKIDVVILVMNLEKILADLFYYIIQAWQEAYFGLEKTKYFLRYTIKN